MKDFLFNIESQTSDAWIDRAQKSAELIFSIQEQLPAFPALADIGCGDEKLNRILSKGNIRFSYQGYDINPQSDSVKKFDATSDALAHDYDVVVSLGLTEYIELPRFLASMRKFCRFFVVSHVLKNPEKYSEGELRRLGWINHLSAEDFEDRLLSAGFDVLRTSITKNNKTKIWLCA